MLNKKKPPHPFSDGLDDVILSVKRLNLSLYFAWSDTKARYGRSILGPFWLVLSSAISIVGLGYLWSILFHQTPQQLIPSLTAGLIMWQFVSSSIIESPATFIRNAHYIRNMVLPYVNFINHQLCRQLINLAHNLILVIAVLIIYPPNLSSTQLLVIPGMTLVILNLMWMNIVIAIIGARFRDLEQIISAVMPLLFFITPIIFHYKQLTIGQQLIWLNPFSYFITLVRDPIIGFTPPLFVYTTSLTILILGWLIAIYLLGKNKRLIPFWI